MRERVEGRVRPQEDPKVRLQVFGTVEGRGFQKYSILLQLMLLLLYLVLLQSNGLFFAVL